MITLRGKEISNVCFFLFLFLFLIGSSSSSVAKMNHTNKDYSVNTILSISDLEWYSGSFDMYDYNWSKEFNPVSTGSYGFDKNSTVLHAYEITGTHRHYVGWYTNFTVTGEFLSLNFSQKTKANHLDAVRNFVHIIDLATNQTLQRVDSKGNGFGFYENATLETDFLSYEYIFSTKGVDNVILFFGFYDSWSADWQQETWIKEVEIDTDVSSTSFDTTNFVKQISSPIAEPQELLWIEDKLYCIGMNLDDNTKSIIEINPITDEVLDYHTLNEIDVNFPACALAFDGDYFWTIKNNGYGSPLILQKYNNNFIFVESNILDLSTPSNAIGYGLTFDGAYLWMSDPHAEQLYQINSTTAEIIHSIPAPGTSPRGLEYEEGYLWVVESSENMIHKISPTTGSIIESYPTFCEYPWGIAIDDSKTIWITSRASPFIYKTKVVTETVVKTSIHFLFFFLPILLILFKQRRKRKSYKRFESSI